MEFHHREAELFVPDETPLPSALERTTHLCIGAHQDDQEFMAYHGIAECFGRGDRWFTGVVVTDGSGSARAGLYADFSDDDMMAVRHREQRKAAYVGEYACQVQLGYPSAEAKDPASAATVVADLLRILQAARPRTVYLHNPADKHDTHVACCLRALDALRALPEADRPQRVYGCEIWRDLDWLLDEDKTILPVNERENLAAALSGVFDSQLCGGKRYDQAIRGRWHANASMLDSHAIDEEPALSWALDLTPLVHDPGASVIDYTLAFLDRLRADITHRAKKVGGR